MIMIMIMKTAAGGKPMMAGHGQMLLHLHHQRGTLTLPRVKERKERKERKVRNLSAKKARASRQMVRVSKENLRITPALLLERIMLKPLRPRVARNKVLLYRRYQDRNNINMNRQLMVITGMVLEAPMQAHGKSTGG